MAWLDDVGFFIKDSGASMGVVADGITAAGSSAYAPGTTGPAPTQGFSLDRDEAQTMLTQAKAIRDDIWNLKPKAEALTKMKAPADEIASNAYNMAHVGNGQGNPGAAGYGAGHIQKEYDYLTELVGRLERALGMTDDSDQQAGTDVKNAPENGGLAG